LLVVPGCFPWQAAGSEGTDLRHVAIRVQVVEASGCSLAVFKQLEHKAEADDEGSSSDSSGHSSENEAQVVKLSKRVLQFSNSRMGKSGGVSCLALTDVANSW
jgi:hypothetical protein